MTDTKAPERINLLEEDIEEFKDTHPVEGSTCFIPCDLHLAAVAAAYEDAGGKCVDYYRDVSSNENGPIMAELDMQSDYIERRILSSTPTDAQAALDARDKRIRAEALREAIDKVNQEKPQSYTGMQRVLKTLIGKEQTDE